MFGVGEVSLPLSVLGEMKGGVCLVSAEALESVY